MICELENLILFCCDVFSATSRMRNYKLQTKLFNMELTVREKVAFARDTVVMVKHVIGFIVF